MAREIYLDNASSTPIDKRVQKEIERAFSFHGNPSSLNSSGRKAREVLESSRSKIAKLIGAKKDEVIFTGSGTESNNLAIIGAALANKGKHIITSNIEHKSVLAAIDYLVNQEGFRVTKVKVNKKGLIDPKDVSKAIKKDTVLVSIMYANNEIGTIHPIRKIINEIRMKNKNVIFHTDACQALGYLDINTNNEGIDLMTFNSSKVYGPKGVGALFVKTGIKLNPIIYGGDQEQGLRSGTENVAGIVGFAKALEIAQKNRSKEVKRLTNIRNYFIKNLKDMNLQINGDEVSRLPNNVNVSIPNTNGEFLILNLDKLEIRASTGSACQVHDSSHVLKAIGVSEDWGTIRFSMGKDTTKEDIDFVLKNIPKAISKSLN